MEREILTSFPLVASLWTFDFGKETLVFKGRYIDMLSPYWSKQRSEQIGLNQWETSISKERENDVGDEISLEDEARRFYTPIQNTGLNKGSNKRWGTYTGTQN